MPKMYRIEDLPFTGLPAKPFNMGNRCLSLLLMIGLLLGMMVMPAMAQTTGISPVHSGEMVDAHAMDDAGHEHEQTPGKEMPCPTVSHHHCSAALQLDAPRIGTRIPRYSDNLRPATAAPLASRNPAPPLDPPLA